MSDDPLVKIRDWLDRVAAIKMPTEIRMGRGNGDGERQPLSPREKIEQLESYLLLTAEARQLAHSAQLAAYDALFDCRVEMEQGWENYLSGSRAKATGPQIEEAKRKAHPETFAKGQRLDWLVKRLGEQIRRLEQDDAAASRVYTLITGA